MMVHTGSTAWRDRVMAVLAGGLVLGVGGSLTLAAWQDEEWVFGGTNGGTAPGLGTTSFEVQQDARSTYTAAGASWADFESNPGDELTFTTGALVLDPGKVVYAPVALSTTPASIAGTLVLRPAVPAVGITVNDPGDLLWSALVVSVRAVASTANVDGPVCGPATFLTSYDTAVLTDQVGLGTGVALASQSLSAARGNVVHYCFEIELPLGAVSELQGRTVAPAWQFIATSS